eukprot:957681-Pelagomonas_calceolata.AAC.3
MPPAAAAPGVDALEAAAAAAAAVAHGEELFEGDAELVARAGPHVAAAAAATLDVAVAVGDVAPAAAAGGRGLSGWLAGAPTQVRLRGGVAGGRCCPLCAANRCEHAGAGVFGGSEHG